MVAVGKMGFDVLLWQLLASVAVPGLTINIAVSREPIIVAAAATAIGVSPWVFFQVQVLVVLQPKPTHQ